MNPRRLLAFALAASLSFTACTGRHSRADFVLLNGIEPESLDPAIITGQPEMRVVQALFEGLTARDKNGETGPGMADTWTISPDGLTYTFHIRDGASWSNGEPLTAHDFAASWRRALEPATASDYAEMLYPITGAEAYNKGDLTDFSQVGIHATDPSRLVVTLRAPTAYFLHLCSFPTLSPVWLPGIEKHGMDWIKPGKLVCNGAYTLGAWRINDRIRLVKNPRYWRADSVALGTVDVLPIAHATTAFNFFALGQAHLVLDKGNIPPMLLGELAHQPYFHSAPILATYFYRFNVTRPPFNDPRVRQAIALALDKNYFVQRITCAGEPVTGSFTPPGLSGYTPPQGLGENVALARRLLAEAGYPEGRGFPSFSLLYNKTDQDENVATAFQAQMKERLGLRVELRNQEWKVYLNSMSRLEYDMCRASWVGDYPDPNTFLDCFITGRGNNRTGWSHATYDRLVNGANREVDPARRYAMLAEAEKILVEQELPIIPIFHFVGIQLYDATKLGGFEPNLVDEHPLREMYWKQKP